VRLLRRRKVRAIVVNGLEPENILRAVKNERVGTVIS